MTELVTRSFIRVATDIEAVLAGGPVRAAEIRAECERRLAELESRANTDARTASRRDHEPEELKRRIEFIDEWTCVRKAELSVAEPAQDPVQLEKDYRELLLTTKAAVGTLYADHLAWRDRNPLIRALTPWRRPATMPPDWFDHAQTLLAWEQEIRSRRVELERRRKEQEKAEARQSAATQLEELERQQSEAISKLQSTLSALVAEQGASARPWDSPEWQAHSLSSVATTTLRLGRYAVRGPSDVARWEIPATVPFPLDSPLVIDTDTESRAAAIELARSVTQRLLFGTQPGRLQMTFIDPVALGQSVADFQHLVDFDAELVDTRPVTSPNDIERKLADLAIHLETVISKYLRGQFDSIAQYNAAAGEMAEPYRLLVALDYPTAFSDSAAQQLISLIENGPRCGLFTVVVADRASEQPRNIPLERLLHSCTRISMTRGTASLTLPAPIGVVGLEFVPDSSAPLAFDPSGSPSSPFARMLVSVGEASRQSATEAVTLDRFLPVLNRLIRAGRSQSIPDQSADIPVQLDDTGGWWRASSANSTVALLGKAGAQDVASMYFSSVEIAGGAIMVGLPRSGKTTSLHSAILTMAMLYSPAELELYLIDAKHGVEFKIYEQLPHARMISVHSEREFSVAVLKSIDKEIADRAAKMKESGAGIANISEYRSATGLPMSRIVLVIDEFHEIFEEDDRLGHEAFTAFSNIARMGPFAGVHIVVASQTLSSMPAMDRPTLSLLPQRVAFMCNESDSDIVMRDDNKGTRLLSKPGQGLFNPSRGDPAVNKPFQGLIVEPHQRLQVLDQLTRLAEAGGWTRLPVVFDGHTSATRRPRPAPSGESLKRVSILLGEPLSLAKPVEATLRRSRGSNLAMIGDQDDDDTTDFSIRGALHSVITDARAAGVDVDVVDFVGDELIPGALTMAEAAKAGGATYSRGRDMPAVVDKLDDLVRSRTSVQDYESPSRILVLFGLQRAVALRPPDPYDESSDAELAVKLARIMRDGPEVGVHTVVSTDQAGGIERKLGSEASNELQLRLVGALASPADVQWATSSYGSSSDLRPHQLMLCDHLRGTEIRFRAYPPLTHGSQSLARMTG